MVNKQQYNNEEELYQQIMAELEPGAAEFDRLMANGENPASKAKKVPLGRKWYAVAACFIGLLIIGTAYMLHNDSEEQMAETKPTVAPKNIEPMTAHAIDNNIGTTSFDKAQNASEHKALPKVAKKEEDYVYVFQEIEITPSEEDATGIVLPKPERQRSFDVTWYDVPYGGGKVLTFKDQIDQYADGGWEKNCRKIVFSTNNDEDTIVYYITVYDNGRAYVDVRPRTREDISYRGYFNTDEQ